MSHVEKPGHCAECSEQLERLKARVELLEVHPVPELARNMGALAQKVTRLEDFITQHFTGLPEPPVLHGVAKVGSADEELHQDVAALGSILTEINDTLGADAAKGIVSVGVQMALGVMNKDLVNLRLFLQTMRDTGVDRAQLDDWIAYLARYGA
jgi:hypothetical protein